MPTRMRHVRSFHHVVEVVDCHFRADDVSSKGRSSQDFPCPFFLPMHTMKGKLGDKFA